LRLIPLEISGARPYKGEPTSGGFYDTSPTNRHYIAYGNSKKDIQLRWGNQIIYDGGYFPLLSEAVAIEVGGWFYTPGAGKGLIGQSWYYEVFRWKVTGL